MQVDFAKENFRKGWRRFDRERLKRVDMFKGERGTFAIITRTLDRDTLATKTVRSFFSEESLMVVIDLYLTHFYEEEA